MAFLRLTDRSLVEVRGPDAEAFLQNLVTADLEALDEGEVRACALLTPQGKVLFDFLVSRADEGGFLLDVARSLSPDLAKRLILYKLRAKVEIVERSDLPVVAVWDETPVNGIRDSRFRDAAVYRRYGSEGSDDGGATVEAYDLLRIADGVAESGRDFTLSDAFPHDILMDLNDGVSFRKGCFVGQEVVSRMHHRKSARRRLVIVEGAAPLPEAGASLEAGGKPLGTLGTVVGSRALAVVRADRAADALAAKQVIEAAGVAVALRFPDWTGLSFEQLAAADQE